MYTCATCGWLDKTRKVYSDASKRQYRYKCVGDRCNCFWVSKDSDLKEGGCSEWTSKEIADNQIKMEFL